MRKEIVYSLAAVAAIPVVASAAESGASAKGLTIVAANGQLKLTVNPQTGIDEGVTLKAGKYQLFLEELTSAQTNMTVTVKNLDTEAIKTVNIQSGTNTKSESFEVAAGTYSIVIDGPTGFSGSGAAIQFLFDFQAASTTLKTILSNYVNEIEAYHNDEKALDVSNFNKWQGIIDSLGMVNYASELTKLADNPATFNPATAPEADYNDEQKAFKAAYLKTSLNEAQVNAKAYAMYENYNLAALSSETEKTTIEEAMEALYNAAKAHEADHMRDSLQDLRDAVKDVPVNSSTMASDSTAIKGLIADFESGEATSDQVWTAIENMKADVENALAIAEFYKNTAKPYFDAAKKALANEKKAIIDGLNAIPSYDQTKETLKADAEARFTSIQTKLNNLSDSLDRAYADGSLGKDASQLKWGTDAGFLKAVDDIAKWTKVNEDTLCDKTYASLLKDTVAVYGKLTEFRLVADTVGSTTIKKPSAAFLAAHYGSFGYIDSVYAKAIALKPDLNTKMRGKVSTAIANLNDTISKYSHKNPVGLDQTELTDATKGVAKYVKILDDSVKNYIDSLKNYQVMLDSIDSLTMRLDTVVARLDAKYGKTLKNIGKATFGTASTDDPFYFLDPNDKTKEYATSVIKKDKTPLFIKKDKALYTDSIRTAITALNATIANYKSEDTQAAIDKTNGTFGKEAKAIFDDIESLENTAAEPIEKFVKVQTTLDSLFTELNAFETQIQNLDIYKKSVKDYNATTNPAPMIGGYKDKIDTIRGRKLATPAFAITANGQSEDMNSSLAKIQAQLDSARIARGISRTGETSSKTFSWWMNQVAAADTAKLKKCIDLLKKSYKADSIVFAANADQAAFDNLKKSVRELCDSINKIITRVEGEITAADPNPAYGDATENIRQMLNNVKDSLCKNVLGGIEKDDRTYATGDTYYNATLGRADENTPYSATTYDLLGKDSEKLQQLLSKLGQVKQAVEIEKEAQAKNAAAKASLDNYFGKFFEAYNAAKALVAENGSCKDVYQTANPKITAPDFKSAKQWYDDSLGVTTAPTAMATPAEYAAAAWTPEKSIMDKFKKLYNAIVAAQNAGTLVGDTTTYKLKIDTLIADLKGVTDSLKIKQNNLSALITIESFDPSIQELVVDADTKLEAVEDKTNSNSAYAHYKAVIDAMEEGYQGTTALPTRGEDGEDAVEGLLDKAFADYKGDSLNRTQEIYLPAVLQTMLDLRKVEKRATENKENLPDVKSDSLRVANKITALLTELDSYEFGKNQYVTALKGLQTELAAIKVDTLYKYGKLENDSLDNGRQKDIKKIEEKIDSIRLETVGADNYDKLVEDLKLRQKLDSKAKATRGVYNEAVALDDVYQTLKSKTLRDAVAAAKAESDAYNQVLKAYPAQINAAYNKADSSITAYRADEDTRLESYPADKFEGDTAVFNTLISQMKNLSAGYKATADAAIGTSANAFLAAVSATLDDSTHFFNKYAAYDTTSTNAQMLAYKGFIAKLAGQKAVLVKKIADLNKTINGIKDLDDILYDLENWKEGTTNTLGTSYADKNADVLKDAAKHDLTTGETQAKEAIKKGNKFYYNQETITVTDGTELNEAWEAKKLPILGMAATATTEKIPGVADSIATIKPANHEFKYDSISAILDTFLEDTEILIQSEDAYNRWNAALGAANAAANAKGSLQAQLNKAKDDAKNYVVIDDMVNNGGFKTIQDVIDQKRAAAEALREAGLCTFTATDSLDSVKISREIQIVSKLVKDTIENDSDVYLPNIVEANTLFRKEQAYLEGLEDQLWSLFNQAAANKWAEDDENVRVKKGQEYEAELIDIYHDLDSIVTEVNADPKKADAAKLFAIQNRIDELTKGMVAAAGQLGENTQASIKNDLDAAAQAVQDKLTAAAALDKSGLTDAQKTAIETEKTSIQTALNETKTAIAEAKTAKDLPLKEGQFEDKIAALDKKVDALTQKINELNEQNDALTANYAAADATLKTLDEALENLEKAFEKFESIDEDEYANRLALVDSRANDIKDGVQDAKDEKKAVDNTKLTSDVNTLVSDINALIKEAANDDLSKLGEDLEEQVDELIAEKTQNENEFLASDKTSLTNALNTLKNAIATRDNSGDLTGGYRNEVYNNGNDHEYTAYDALKKKGDSLQARIDSLAERMEILLNGGEIPVVTIPGDIDGDGFVTSDDVDAFLDELQNDLLPEDDDDDFEIYDVNGDEVLNIADAQAILNLSLGLNWDGTEIVVEEEDDPDEAFVEAPARRVEAPAGKITAETQQLENGAQRITLTLNGNFDWTGFQMDVKGAEVLSETASQSLRTADLKNGAHRIVAFGTAQGNGRVITIDVQGNAQLGTITFTTANAEAVSFKLGGTTGIYGITTESSNIFYDLSGKLVKGMKKGVNIIRDAAGKAKKAIMK